MIAVRRATLEAGIARFSPAAERAGRVLAFDGTLVTVAGLDVAPGALLAIETPSAPPAGESPEPLLAEAIGFRDSRLLAVTLAGGVVAPGARAVLKARADRIPVGEALFGRVVDGLGRPVDSGPPIAASADWPLGGRPVPPLDRSEVTEPLVTGVRPIDGLLTLGRGQRVGVVAGSGVGKSVLLQQLVRGARTHVVAVPADETAPWRLRGVMAAFAVAEWQRSLGRHALLLVDSLTRVAHAQRELGLALGEPAGPRGYPASALALIPRLVERAGNDRRTGGAVTALLTVLADGDDVLADPVVDTARGVLDGHIVLDRGIAALGRFPAIDLGQSISRTMGACVDAAAHAAAARLKRDAALIDANRDLLAIGAYAPGQDRALDTALARAPRLETFLAQGRDEWVPPEATRAALLETWGND